MNTNSMRVDLSIYFSDARRNSLIFIDACWENIKDVEDHIQKLFRLSNISLLTQDGCYLSPKESIKVLNSVESLKAFKLTEEDLTLSIAENGRKRKHRSEETEVEFSSSTPNNPKRSKGKNEVTDKSTLKPDAADDSRSTRRSSKKYSMQASEACEELEVPEDLEVTEASSQTQAETTRRATSISSGIKSKSRSHIVYQDSDTEETSTIKSVSPVPKVPDVAFRSQLMEIGSSSVRRFKLPQKPNLVQILEDILIPAPSNDYLLKKEGENVVEPLPAQVATDNGFKEAAVPVSAKKLASTPEIIEVKPVELDKTDTKATSKVVEESLLESDSEDDVMVLDDTNLDDSNTSQVIADMLQNSDKLGTLPNVGDSLIFKLNKVKGASKLSAKTDNIAGTCSYVNRRTKSITISIISCSNTTKQILHQYSNSLDDSSDSVATLCVNFQDLIEPRVIISSVD